MKVKSLSFRAIIIIITIFFYPFPPPTWLVIIILKFKSLYSIVQVSCFLKGETTGNNNHDHPMHFWSIFNTTSTILGTEDTEVKNTWPLFLRKSDLYNSFTSQSLESKTQRLLCHFWSPLGAQSCLCQ